MTTNKPEVKRYDCTSGGAQHCYGCYTMKEGELGDYVEWEAHEALQAECEELRTALAESRANDLTAMGYLNQIRQLVGGDDFPDMVRRCEKLRKVADQYRRLIELGEDFQWENIIRVDISDFPSRADAIDSAMQTSPSA